MALLRKYQTGGDTLATVPQTIQIYGEDYDVNTLERAIYSGLDDYLGGLKHGSKHRQEVTEAVDKLWSGMKQDMKDGKRVVYNGSHFTDYQGEYQNATKAKKDYMGMAAHYLSKVFDNATPVEKPKSYDYAPWLVGSVVLRRLFGTSAGDNVGSGSLEDWFLMDEPGEDNIRGTNKRADHFKKILTEVLNDEHAFDEYNWSSENIAKARNAIGEALKALENGIDPSDYSVFATNLGRFGTGAQGWNTLFIGDTRTPAELAQEKEEQQKKQEEEQKIADQWLFIPDDNNPEGIRIPKGDSFELNFNSWLNKKYPRNTNLSEITISKETSKKIGEKSNIITSILLRSNVKYISNALVKEMHGQASNLGNALRNAGIDRNIILPILIGWLYLYGNKEKINDDFWYLKDVALPNNGVLFYNPKTGLVQSRSLHDVPSWMKERQNEFEDKLYEMGIAYHKEGGILTFKKGGEVGKYQDSGKIVTGLTRLNEKEWNWGNNFYQSYLLNLLQAGTDAEDKTKFAKDINEMQRKHSIMYNRWLNRSDKSKAIPGVGNDVQNYQNEIISTYPYVNTSGVEGAQKAGYYKYPQGHYTGDKKGENGEWQSDNWFSYQTDDRRVLPRKADESSENLTSDDIKQLQNKWNEAGYEMYLDQDTQYYMLRVPETRATEENTENLEQDTTPEEDTTPEADKTPGTRSTAGTTSVYQAGDGKEQKTSWLSKIGAVGDFPANLLGVGRLLTHLRGNRKVRDTLLAAQHPALKNTYELYSPVTGDFAAMLNANNLAAQTMRRLWWNQTVDAGTNLAGMLDANSQANQLRTEGFLKDNARIRETAEAALKRRGDNIKRRSDTANENRAAINENNKTRAQIKADWRKKRTETITNWLAETQKNLHTESKERQSLVREANNMGAYMDYQNQQQAIENKYAKKNSDGSIDYTALTSNPNYINETRAAYNQYQQALITNALQRRFYPSYSTYSKQGGKLIKRKRK